MPTVTYEHRLCAATWGTRRKRWGLHCDRGNWGQNKYLWTNHTISVIKWSITWASATHLKSVSCAISRLYFNGLFLHTFLTFIIIMLFCMNFPTLKTECVMTRRCRKNHSNSGSQLESNKNSLFFSAWTPIPGAFLMPLLPWDASCLPHEVLLSWPNVHVKSRSLLTNC